MKIALSAETTLDLTKELLQEYDIKIIPFEVLLGEKVGFDGEITPNEIFDYVDKYKVLPKTTAINEFRYEGYFNDLLQEYDAIIHFSLSSKMSSTFSNAVEASKRCKNVYVVDSASLSTGIALECIYARELIDQGLDVKEVYEKVLKRVPHVQASFVLNTVDYLYKGGRCSSMQRFGANLLRIKPQIIVDNGEMISGKKYRGKNQEVIREYCVDTLAKFNKPDLSVGFVTHSNASEEMIEMAKEALVKKGFKKIYCTTAGATISSHCGPKCLGILYINDGK